jgi:hypothetical protein
MKRHPSHSRTGDARNRPTYADTCGRVEKPASGPVTTRLPLARFLLGWLARNCR